MSKREEFLSLAKSQIGVAEFKDGSNPVIEMYHKFASINNDEAMGDEIPWCSAFVCYIVESCGVKSTNNRAARSWLKWGSNTDSPLPGDIVVISRDGSPTSGHVGFFFGYNTSGNILILGGNQNDSVNITAFKKERLLGFRTSNPQIKTI